MDFAQWPTEPWFVSCPEHETEGCLWSRVQSTHCGAETKTTLCCSVLSHSVLSVGNLETDQFFYEYNSARNAVLGCCSEVGPTEATWIKISPFIFLQAFPGKAFCCFPSTWILMGMMFFLLCVWCIFWQNMSEKDSSFKTDSFHDFGFALQLITFSNAWKHFLQIPKGRAN